ncbi:NUDIX hydrolase [Knoellia sp. S7-12]|uniref:NUDIX hydrolase n=1 Tax=Knoellia sp. S7-12 TaxID=3126698 RepID=UPI003369AD9E
MTERTGTDTDTADAAVAHAFAHLHAEATTTLAGWSAPDASQERLRAAYLDHLQRHPDGVAKAGPPAHLTASCLVISPDGGQVLLTHHRRAKQWFQFGGHLEVDDTSLYAAAIREGREESGIPSVTPEPTIVQLNQHRLHGDFGRCREHLDVRYAAVVDPAVRPATSEESLDVAWWPADALPEGTRTELTALVDAARQALHH